MSGRVTPEELAARGWEGESRCRCLTTDGFVACPPQMCESQQLLDAAQKVALAYAAEAEDWNDGEFALWRKDDLVNALVELRQAMRV